MKLKAFIPIECDILSDNRLVALLNKMGMAGYGIYMSLLVELRYQKDYQLDSESLKLLMRKYAIRRKKLEEVLYDYDLFLIEQMPDGNLLISSEYVTRVMQNYDDTVYKRSIAGKKGADKRWQKEDGKAIAKEKRIKEKKITEEKDKKETVVATDADCEYDINPVREQHWQAYLDAALSDRMWMEFQAKHSGLGERFVKYEEAITQLFKEHVVIHAKENELRSVDNVKYYFANFVRDGTFTNNRIVEELDKLERHEKQNDIYRFETIDPVTGERSYYGKPIPPDAPPRPDDRYVWDPIKKIWD